MSAKIIIIEHDQKTQKSCRNEVINVIRNADHIMAKKTLHTCPRIVHERKTPKENERQARQMEPKQEKC